MVFSRRETAILLIVDGILLVVSLLVALSIRNLAIPSFSYFSSNLIPFIPVFLFSIAIFYVAGFYEKPTRPARRVMGERIVGAQIANTILAAVFFFVLPLTIAPKTILVLYLITSVVAITFWRFYALSHLAPGRRIRAVVVGSGQTVDEITDELANNDRSVAQIVATINTNRSTHESLSDSVASVISKKSVQFVILDTRDENVLKELPLFYQHILKRVVFVDLTSFYENMFERVPLNQIDYSWLFDALPRRHFIYDVTKRLFDIVLSLVGAIPALIVLTPAVIVLLVAGGTPFIFHERIGRYGKTFRISKLRTMLLNDHGDPELQKKNYVTRFGTFLRKTRVDELPQIWNVFIGDLSFIGPRPELPRIARVYEQEIPYYQARHLVTPGLSGWAQIRDYDAPRGGADVDKTRNKLSYDLYYLKHRSLALDFVIALKTLRALASLSGS